MPLGDLNVAPTFLALIMKLQMEWDKLSKKRRLKNIASKIIVDDVLLYGHTSNKRLAYFRAVLYVLKHHCATIKVKKLKWFQYRCGFVGVGVTSGVTQPAHSKKRRLTRYSNLIHGETFTCSLVSSYYTASSCPYMIWTSYPGGTSCQNSPNQENYIKGSILN